MKYAELKNYCLEKIKQYPDLEKKLKREIVLAKRYYDNDVELDKYLVDNKDKISNKYIIPFLLGITNEVIDGEIEYRYIKEGSSGGRMVPPIIVI